MKRFPKALWDHPFLDYARRRGAVLTPKEAVRVIHAGAPSFEEMIGAAKARFAGECVSWEIFDATIATRRRRSTAVSWAYGHRRFAIAALVIALLLAFFTLAPTGRALAEKFYNMVMQVVGAQVEFTDGSKPAEERFYNPDNLQTANLNDSSKIDQNVGALGYKEYAVVQDFEKSTGFRPIYFDNDLLTLRKICRYVFDADAVICVIEYTTADGLLVSTREVWRSMNSYAYEVENAVYTKGIAFQDQEIMYTISPSDGSFVGMVLLKDSFFAIAAEKGVDVEKLLTMLKEYKAPQ